MNTQSKGRNGEQMARRFLQRQGLQYVSQNFHRRIGEIDLIMFDEHRNSWVLVEVRYRSKLLYGNPVNSVDYHKQQKLKRVARAFLQSQTSDKQHARIDVIAITPIQQSNRQSDLERSLNLYGRVSEEFEDHQIDWIINAVEG